jgi:deazaflavin-dependent oxidoreductase (nitroreductase family)
MAGGWKPEKAWKELDMAKFSEIPWIAEHIALYETDPEKAHMWDSGPLGGPGLLPTLLLTTTGRKSGEPRSLPLIYGEVDGSYVIIASKGGMPTHPVWFLNLEANPACELMVGAKAVSARARVAEGEERDRIWSKMAEIYPPYLDYQKATEREIPVVVLDPA